MDANPKLSVVIPVYNEEAVLPQLFSRLYPALDALQVPYDETDDAMPSHTISTAQEAGWIWDIGLPHRRGTGYVYSSRHTRDEDALETLMRYVGPVHRQLTPRKISIRGGHRTTFWKNNCVAVGLAAGFLEPLESSAIVLIELSAKLIAEQMPANREVMDLVSMRFNETHRFGHHRAGQFLVLESRGMSAFHVADAADAIDDGARVLFVRRLLQQFGMLQPNGIIANIR